MEFAVSDRIVHPHHGTGQITGVEHIDLIEGYEQYYVIEMTRNRLILRVPIRKTSELGIRPVMSKIKLDGVLENLRDEPNKLPGDYKLRQAHVREALKSGRVIQIAEAVRDLIWHKKSGRLTRVDFELLDRGREVLAGEMALVIGRETAEADQLIMSILSASIEAKSDQMVS